MQAIKVDKLTRKFNSFTAVDGMRASLIGQSTFPVALDFAVLLCISAVMVFLGAYFSEKSESV